MRRPGALVLGAALALVSLGAAAQTMTPSKAPPPAAAPSPAATPAPPPATTAAPAGDGGARDEAELGASRKAVQDLEAQVIELRRIIEGMDRSRASVDDLRRRVDELEARLGENDRTRAWPWAAGARRR